MHKHISSIPLHSRWDVIQTVHLSEILFIVYYWNGQVTIFVKLISELLS
jgi:hypothetical protein